MGRTQKKVVRLREIEELLLAEPNGLTQAELARRLGVDRSTISRNIADLTEIAPYLYEDDEGRLHIDRNADLLHLSLNVHEALAIHLAARLLATRMDRKHRYAATTLVKLSVALERYAPLLARHVAQSASLLEDEAQRDDPVYLHVLETLTTGWAEQRRVHLWYQREAGAPVQEYLFSPYFIEPYAVGQSTYTLGMAQWLGHAPWQSERRRTFKIERIRRAELTREPYTIPEQFDPQAWLSSAWGVWSSEEEPVEVQLKFSPTVAARVRETRWHRSEVVETLPDGSLLWRASIAEPQEMLPWIRGWGADCEVLAPDWLRKKLENEAKRLARVYGVRDIIEIPVYQQLWAKLNRKKSAFHPLICHMLDVAAVTQIIWRETLNAGIREHLANQFKLDEEAIGRWLAFWASLHDLGKASPAFQRLWPDAVTALNTSLAFDRSLNSYMPHGWITAETLKEKELGLERYTGSQSKVLKKLARVLGGHHGTWPTSEINVGPGYKGDREWYAVRQELVKTLENTIQPPILNVWPWERNDTQAFLTWFSGLVSVADWIGSMESYFPYEDVPVNPQNYFSEQALPQAQRALQNLHWEAWNTNAETVEFKQVFSFEPNSMQQAAMKIAESLQEPALVLIEAPTGSGKTEAALYLIDVWRKKFKQRGFYIAMPTMATSNQMWERTWDFVRKRYGSATAPMLIHSHAKWMELPPEPEIIEEEINQEEVSQKACVYAQSWFTPRKRSFLAPCAVGTVDQALLSVLETKHFFVRLFGLSDKTLVFDEIHAYDTYMNVLFQRLLEWLRLMRTSVVLLSATLPDQTRKEVLKAYGGETIVLPSINYPAITWVTRSGKAGTLPLPQSENRRIALHRISRTHTEQLVEALEDALSNGGCAAVICNTVSRAQEIYRKLCETQLASANELFLFHARFPFSWRENIEHTILERFGKHATHSNGRRPKRAIVVATQVIEQSLDLDFDVIFTDLAPIDLLIQRLGRLHRHPRQERPDPLKKPTVYLMVDLDESGLPVLETDTLIYEPYILLKTMLVLQERDELSLPQEVAKLIENVYDSTIPTHPKTWADALTQAQQKMNRNFYGDVNKAEIRLVRKPDDEELLTSTRAELEEENPALHERFQALTRLGTPSITLICIYQTTTGLNTEIDGSGYLIDLERYPETETVKALLNSSVSINQSQIVRWFLDHPENRPKTWQNHGLLRDCYVAIFNSENGLCILQENLVLRLTRDAGLEVLKNQA